MVSVIELPNCCTLSACLLAASPTSLAVVADYTFTLKANCSTILVAFATVCVRLNFSCFSRDRRQSFSSTPHLATWEFLLLFANRANSSNGNRFARPVPSL